MSDNNIECYGELVSEVLTAISQVYWGRMYKYIKDNNIDYKDVNCFILNPESMAVYFSKTFIAMPKLILRCNYLKNAPMSLWITSWSSMDIADIECKWCHLV